MITYTDLLLRLKDKLEDLGLGEIPSHYLKEKGNTVFTGEVNDNLLSTVLQLEINGRTFLKMSMEQEAERSKQSIENNRNEILIIKIQQAIDKYFPKSKMREDFVPLYPGFIWRTTEEVRKLTTLDDDHNVQLNGMVEENPHPENMGAIDRLLHDARVSKYTRVNETWEDVIVKVVKKEGTHQFFKL